MEHETPTLLSAVTVPLLDDLEKLLVVRLRDCSKRHSHLQQSWSAHNYVWTTNNFEQWIEQQFVLACSDEFAREYENVALVQKKFEELQMAVEAGSERFAQCEYLAMDLVDNKSRYSTEILDRQEQLRSMWHEFSDAVSKQQRNLSEIHGFCCGVEDARYGIQEMNNALPEDLGSNLGQVQSYQKDRETFNSGLTSMRAQIKDKVTSLLHLRERLQCMWQDRSEYLQQLHTQHTLLHEAHQPGNLQQLHNQHTLLHEAHQPGNLQQLQNQHTLLHEAHQPGNPSTTQQMDENAVQTAKKVKQKKTEEERILSHRASQAAYHERMKHNKAYKANKKEYNDYYNANQRVKVGEMAPDKASQHRALKREGNLRRYHLKQEKQKRRRASAATAKVAPAPPAAEAAQTPPAARASRSRGGADPSHSRGGADRSSHRDGARPSRSRGCAGPSRSRGGADPSRIERS